MNKIKEQAATHSGPATTTGRLCSVQSIRLEANADEMGSSPVDQPSWHTWEPRNMGIKKRVCMTSEVSSGKNGVLSEK